MDWEIIIFGILIIAFIGSCVFLLKLIYHGSIMLGNIKSDKAGFLGPFIVFFPSMFNETGQKHWRSYPPTFFALLICGGVMVICAEYLGIN